MGCELKYRSESPSDIKLIEDAITSTPVREASSAVDAMIAPTAGTSACAITRPEQNIAYAFIARGTVRATGPACLSLTTQHTVTRHSGSPLRIGMMGLIQRELSSLAPKSA